MKRFVATILAALMIFALASCDYGKNENSLTPTADTSVTDSKKWPSKKYPAPQNCTIVSVERYEDTGYQVVVKWADADAVRTYITVLAGLGEFEEAFMDNGSSVSYRSANVQIYYDEAETEDGSRIIIN